MKNYEQALLKADVKVVAVYVNSLKRNINEGDRESTAKKIEKLQDYLQIMANTLK